MASVEHCSFPLDRVPIQSQAQALEEFGFGMDQGGFDLDLPQATVERRDDFGGGTQGFRAPGNDDLIGSFVGCNSAASCKKLPQGAKDVLRKDIVDGEDTDRLFLRGRA
jgi:hypothetical protein